MLLRRSFVFPLIFASGWGVVTRGDVVVTLEAKDAAGRIVTAAVPAGTVLVVDVSLSTDEEDDPLIDLRSIQFDFAASDTDISLGTFAWRLDDSIYAVQSTALPTPSAASLATASDGTLLVLDRTPLRVATIDVTVNGDGTLNAIGPTASDRTSDALITAGFDPVLRFSLFDGNLSGGTIQLESSGSITQDRDGDGTPDATDAFPDDPAESLDTDGDGTGDNADTDDDGDGVLDADDAFPLDASETLDSDGDGVGDNADAFPQDAGETLDTDGDGTGNNADADDDGDGVPDAEDAFPLDPTETRDSDGDGVGDNAEMNTNTGPRVTGSLCGVLSPLMLGIMLVGPLCLRRVAPGK